MEMEEEDGMNEGEYFVSLSLNQINLFKWLLLLSVRATLVHSNSYGYLLQSGIPLHPFHSNHSHRSNGILEHEGNASESVEEEDVVSQAEECYAWNESIHSVQIGEYHGMRVR